MYSKIKLSGRYRKFTKRGDPRASIQLPENVFNELTALAEYNKRTLKEEIIARLVKTLELNEEFMGSERLLRMLTLERFAHQERAPKQSSQVKLCKADKKVLR